MDALRKDYGLQSDLLLIWGLNTEVTQRNSTCRQIFERHVITR